MLWNALWSLVLVGSYNLTVDLSLQQRPFGSGQDPVKKLPSGVSIPHMTDLATRLTDADELLQKGHYREALLLLDQVLDATPDALVRLRPDDWLFVGAVAQARLRLQSLPSEAQQVWEEFHREKANQILENALHPPDVLALQEIKQRFPATQAGRRAEQALQELLLDRGYPERAAQGQPLHEIIPEDWIAALPAPAPEAPLRAPSYQSLKDPTIPLVRANNLRERWRYSFQDSPFPQNFMNFRMAIAGAAGYLSDSREVVALDLANGDVLWRFAGPPGWESLNTNARRDLIDGFEENTLIAPVVADGVVLVVLQEAIPLGLKDTFRRIAVRRQLPARRLYALDAESGALLWTQKVPWMTRPDPVGIVASPPAVALGRVFVPVYDGTGTVDLSLQALDLHSGEPIWKTYLLSGQRETTNLFGNVLRELACNPPVADADRVLLSTNLGAICALEAESGLILWTHVYERTVVNAYQTGREGDRETTFSNNPPGYTGDKFFCTPTDSRYALCLDAVTGERLALWPAHSRSSMLRSLIATLPEGAYFSGESAAFQPLPGKIGMRMQSRRLFNDYSSQRFQGVLAQDEFLVPTHEGIKRIDPHRSDGYVLGNALDWEKKHYEMGGLQVAPAMLFVLRAQGITAYESPDALIEALTTGQQDPQSLAQLLPFLEGLDLSHEPALAKRVAYSAQDMAKQSTNLEQRERLLLISGRAFLDAGELSSLATILAPLLQSASVQRQRSAAMTLIDGLERQRPLQPVLSSALEILQNAPTKPVLRRGGYLEFPDTILARTDYLQAKARGDLNQQRKALLHILRLPSARNAQENGQALTHWAGSQLQGLLIEPGQRSALERDAKTAFAELPAADVLAHSGLVQAFAGTRMVSEWLREQSSRPDLDRSQQIRLAAWLRDYGDGAKERNALLDAERLFGDFELPELPERIQPLASTQLGARELLAVEDHPDGAILLYQQGTTLGLSLLTSAGEQRQSSFDLSDQLPPNLDLRPRAFLTSESVCLVLPFHWIRLGLDQTQEIVAWPARSLDHERMGSMMAVLTQGHTEGLRLFVRDLRSGELFADIDLPRFQTGTVDLFSQNERLYLLQTNLNRLFQFDFATSTEVQTTQLPLAPNALEVQSALPLQQGLFLKRSSPVAMMAVRPGGTQSFEPSGSSYQIIFGGPQGVGWWYEPFGRSSKEDPKIFWLGKDRSQPSEFRLSSEETLRIPQLEANRQQRRYLPNNRLLVVSRPNDSPTDQTTIREFRFDTVTARPEISWSVTLADVPFRKLPLSRRMPLPIAAKNGWFVPVALISRTRDTPSELRCLLFSQAGEVADIFATAIPPKRNGHYNLATYLLANKVVLRSGSQVFLLGQS